MEPQIRYARTSDGVNIAYATMGAGPAFIWPGSFIGSISENWRIPELRQLLEGIASRALLVSYDVRGSGLSDRDDRDADCEAMVRDLEAVVEAAGIDRFTLQTWGYGSIPAIAYAERHPDKVMALVLLNGIIRGSDMSAGWKSLVRIAGEDWEYAKRLLAQSNEAGYALTTTLQEIRRAFDRTLAKEAFLSFFQAVELWDASDLAPRVNTPALVLHYGELAPHYPLEACRRLAASIGNGTFVSVEPEGQAIQASAASAVRGFLRGALPRDPQRQRWATAPALPSGTAVILFADIVDSTALTEHLGDAAFRAKARELGGALRALIRERGGTPIEGPTLGDGVLAVFTSAREAIEAARRCSRVGDDAGLPLHLGLHAGDVTREKDPDGRDNVYGGAVNIAARISGLSAPGDVLVSDTVRSLARTSAGVTFEDRGEQSLKGVGETVRVWKVEANKGGTL
jgi:class 3 adenylate cyclase